MTVMIGVDPHKGSHTAVAIDGDERERWWKRAVAAYPPYAEYQEKTERRIPVFVASRRAPE